MLPAISIKGLSKTYPIQFARLRKWFRRPAKEPVTALREVSLEIAKGEIFGLIGRNGAGKTTLTKIVATLVQPTSGSVAVNGFDTVSDDERVRAQIGLAGAEERSFYWRLTAEQNLLFFARLNGLGEKAARNRITDLLAGLEMEEARRRRFGELSTGNKQRLAVARALLSNAPVILLDEPTRSLDPLAAARMRETIKALATRDPPATILFTSHNLAEVETLCDRVAIISRGEIKALDKPARLRAERSTAEQVQIHLADIGRETLDHALSSENLRYIIFEMPGGTSLQFEHNTGDDQLNKVLKRLMETGARIVDVEIKRSTLFDVLEQFEKDENISQL